jgi:hypothetical protein
MRQCGKKRDRNGGSKVSKKIRDNLMDDDEPVFVQPILDKDVPTISLSPDLDELLYPLTGEDFLDNFFRKKAVHVSCTAQHETRVSNLREEMFGLDPEMILRESSSDNIFLWLLGKELIHNDNINENDKRLIRSIEISNVDTAISLHKIAGHATYCRAPSNVEQSLVASLLKATGLGCGQYDPSGESVISMGRGEVETFISTEGHVTNWHYDFQENFTIQLSGIKRWTIQSGTIQDPIRGCTPHYAAPEAVESQLKAAHLFDKKFSFGYPVLGLTATGQKATIDVKPGDVFYFPAGMWHKVETIDPGVSINVSLMASNYASVTCQALEHYLYKDPKWREPVLNNSSNSAVDHLKSLLKDLPSMIQQLENDGTGAQAILPPILTFPPRFQAVVEDEDGEWETLKEDDERASLKGESTEGEIGKDIDDDNCDDDTNGTTGKMEYDETYDILDPCEFDSYPDGWTFDMESGPKTKISKNPLAALHRLDEVTFFNGSEDDNAHAENNYSNAFVLNINYAGNEMHQSAVRVLFRDNEEGFAQNLYNKERRVGSGSDTFINANVSDSNLPFLKFLIFHGYLVQQ